MKKRWVVTLLIVVAAAIAFVLVRRQEVNHTEQAHYEQATFTREHMAVTLDATGIVEPRNRLEIKPPIGGRIDAVLAEEGQTVKKGDIIVRMSSTERATLLDAARARGTNTLSKWEDAYKATPLMAPLDGTIIARNTEPGQTVTAADAILVLSDRLIVMAQVDETDIGQIEVGQVAQICLDAYPDVTVRGVVKRIAFEALTVNNVTVYQVEVEPEQVPASMKSGMTATVAFTIAEADDVLTLETAALTVDGEKTTVLLADGDTATPHETRRVLTGLSDSGRTEILAGLEGTERVLKRAFTMPQRKASGTSPFMPSRKR